MKNEKKFLIPELEIINFVYQDIITDSVPTIDEDEDEIGGGSMGDIPKPLP